MNNEYLWGRKGEDQEIERLEKTLAVFRYREIVKPEAIAAQPAHQKTPRWRISLVFAFASCVAVAFLATAWLRFSSDNSAPVSAGEVVFVQQSTDAPEAEPVVAPKLPPVSSPEKQYQPPGKRRHNVSRTTAAISRRPKTRDTAPGAELTAEERFAYRQLMLALSITGSKLKIVQDTIDGTEDSNDDSKNQR